MDGFVATEVGSGGRNTEFSLHPNNDDKMDWN